MNKDARVPVRHPQVGSRSIEDQAVLVLSDAGRVNILNPVGTLIWDLVDGKHDVSQIVQEVVAHYQVTEAAAEQDVNEFLQDLERREAIIWKV